MDNAEKLDAAMDYSRDYDYDYFGFKARWLTHSRARCLTYGLGAYPQHDERADAIAVRVYRLWNVRTCCA